MKDIPHPLVIEFIADFIYDNLIEYKRESFDSITINGKMKLLDKYVINLPDNEWPEDYKFNRMFWVDHIISRVLKKGRGNEEKEIYNEILEILGDKIEDFDYSMTAYEQLDFFKDLESLLEINMLPREKVLKYIKFEFFKW